MNQLPKLHLYFIAVEYTYCKIVEKKWIFSLLFDLYITFRNITRENEACNVIFFIVQLDA